MTANKTHVRKINFNVILDFIQIDDISPKSTAIPHVRI